MHFGAKLGIDGSLLAVKLFRNSYEAGRAGYHYKAVCEQYYMLRLLKHIKDEFIPYEIDFEILSKDQEGNYIISVTNPPKPELLTRSLTPQPIPTVILK